MSDTWMTRKEVAARWNKSPTALAQWACQGIGPRYAVFGRSVRYSLADIEAYEQAALNSPTVNLADRTA